MSITVESSVEGVSLDWVQFFVESKGEVIQQIQNKTVGLLDEGVKAFAQLIFSKEQPEVEEINDENPCILELLYNLQGESKSEIQILLTAYSVTDDPDFYQDSETTVEYFNTLMTENLDSAQEQSSDMVLDIFDYQQAMKDWNISYIACRDSEILPKFVNDPAFSLVFINDEVAIFTVEKGVD
jgi:hypothetical protein